MRWSEGGANAVVEVRAWLKSGRWKEAMAMRVCPGRSYRRQQAGREAQVVGESGTVGEAAVQRQPAGLPSEVLARVRAEMAQEQATHPWRKAWSRRQQCAQHAEKLARR
jgi:hypothetical protein